LNLRVVEKNISESQLGISAKPQETRASSIVATFALVGRDNIALPFSDQ
jgi:hypothetical protein